MDGNTCNVTLNIIIVNWCVRCMYIWASFKSSINLFNPFGLKTSMLLPSSPLACSQHFGSSLWSTPMTCYIYWSPRGSIHTHILNTLSSHQSVMLFAYNSYGVHIIIFWIRKRHLVREFHVFIITHMLSLAAWSGWGLRLLYSSSLSTQHV